MQPELYFTTSQHILPRYLHQSHKTKLSSQLFGLEAQFPVESLCARWTTEEVFQGLHLILRASLLQHHVSISTALLGTHWVLGEDGVEHVCRVDLGG